MNLVWPLWLTWTIQIWKSACQPFGSILLFITIHEQYFVMNLGLVALAVIPACEVVRKCCSCCWFLYYRSSFYLCPVGHFAWPTGHLSTHGQLGMQNAQLAILHDTASQWTDNSTFTLQHSLWFCSSKLARGESSDLRRQSITLCKTICFYLWSLANCQHSPMCVCIAMLAWGQRL